MATDTSSPAPRKRGILFKLGIVLAALIVLLVIAFFVVTSSAFFKGVILPKVGASMNSDITVSSASIGLSEVTLNDLKLVPHGRDQLLQAQLVRTRFSLSDIIGGNIVVHELTLQSPVITIVKNDTDGTSNLDPLTQKKPATEEKKPAAQQPSAKENNPPKIDITNVSIKNAQVTMTEKLKAGGQKVTQVSDFNFSVDRLQNGQPGKLQITGNAKIDQPATKDAEAAALAVSLAVNFDYKLANDLSPESAKGTAKAEIANATGAFADLTSSAVNLNCDLTPTQIQNLALQFQRGGNALGELRVNGPFSVEKKEGKFNIDLVGLDKQVLNFAGAKQGLEFNNTKINSTNQIEITQNGNAVAVSGNFNASQFSVTQKADNQTTPPLDLNIAYQVNVDQNKQSALLQKLEISGVQNQQQILTGNLSKPMPVSWGQGAGVPEEAAFALNVNNLNLADWKAFAADLNPSGAVTVTLNINSRNGGKQLALDLNTHLANFGAKFGSNQIANADIQLTTKGEIAEFKKITLSEYQLKLAQQNQAAVTLAGSATVDSSTKGIDFKSTVNANLPKLLQIVSVPDVNVTSGTATITLTVSSQNADKQLALDLNTHIADFGGKFGSNQIANADIQLTAKGEVADLKRISFSEYQLKLAQQNQLCVTLAGSGTVDSTTKAADLKATLDANLPQLLQTISVPGVNITSGDVKFDGHIVQNGNAQSVTGQLTLASLSGNLDKTKLDRLTAQVNADIAMNGADVNIKKLNGAVTQADQPAGNFDVSGNWNLSNKVGQITAKLAGFNERLLGPFLAPSLNGKQLVSVQIDGSANANMQSVNAGTVNADLTVTNLVVRDPAQPNTNAPLYAHFVVDGSMQKNVLNLKNAMIGLSPTQRAKNELQLNGQVDLSKSNNIVANLTAHSDALDVTQWYDLYAKPKSTAKTAPQAAANETSPTATTSAGNSNTEPAPVKLPIQKATVDVSIGHLYLHDLDVTEKCTLNISDNSHVIINPLEITINNAPIKANVDLDLSVPGYKYNLTFSADKVPVGALADTFAPASKGAYRGDLIANANFKGIGTTGTSMRKELSGQATLTLTNAQVKLSLSKTLSTIINAVGKVLNTPELSQVPITWIGAELTAGNGQIKISKLGMQSAVFEAQAPGTIQIADVLTNSPLDLQVEMSLAQQYAKRVGLGSGNPNGSGYVDIPQFLGIGGTVGKPKEMIKINPLSVVKTGVGVASKYLPKNAQGLVQGAEGLFGGNKAQSPAAAPTTNNAPSSNNQNNSSATDLFNAAKSLFGRPKK